MCKRRSTGQTPVKNEMVWEALVRSLATTILCVTITCVFQYTVNFLLRGSFHSQPQSLLWFCTKKKKNNCLQISLVLSPILVFDEKIIISVKICSSFYLIHLGHFYLIHFSVGWLAAVNVLVELLSVLELMFCELSLNVGREACHYNFYFPWIVWFLIFNIERLIQKVKHLAVT